MFKEKFILKIDTTDFNNVDPNLKSIDYRIARNKTNLFTKDNYDFEICAVIDGYIENSYINDILTVFYHDIIDEKNYFHNIFLSDDCPLFIQKFIKNLFSTSGNANSEKRESGMKKMDAIMRADGKEFTFAFYLPDTIITKEKFDEFLNLGPDGLIGNMSNDEIFEYFLPYLYKRLAEDGLLDNKDLKNPIKYYIGLH